MRRLTASVLATAAIAGGVLTGAALAAPTPSHSSAVHVALIERSSSKQGESVKSRAMHESANRDRSLQTHEHSTTHDR